ncbi:Pectate lyase B like protein [Verticillium longisporum]
MKFSGIASSVAVLAAVASATPTPASWTPKSLLATRTIEKRASVEDACDIGFCTEGTGTTGGAGGPTTTVTSLADYQAALEAEGAAIIVVDGAISGSARIRLASDKTVIGLPGSSVTGIGHYINKQSNVILRNLKISKVVAANGDAIGIQESTNVWVDHCDLSSDLDSGKDFYDGLLDITRASDFITVSNTYLHDHHKASLIGHSDNNAAQDTGKFHVSYINNHWENTGSRNPSVRFGTAVHIVNNLYENVGLTGVNARMGAQILVESTSFVNSANPIVSRDSDETGFAVVKDVIGADDNAVPEGTLTSVPYAYTALGSANVGSVAQTAGQKLTFDGSSAPAPAPAPETPVESAPATPTKPVEETPEEPATPVESAPATEPSAPVADDEEVEEVCTRRRVKKSLRLRRKALRA